MKSKAKKPVKKGKLRDQILNSARASHKIEGIHISARAANKTLKKVAISLER